MIEGDPEQLDRVLSNLLSNAVKYTAPGGTVTLTAGRSGADALLTVTDTGMGIPEQEQKSLFTRFFRASNAVARAIPGSGLGLSIVRQPQAGCEKPTRSCAPPCGQSPSLMSRPARSYFSGCLRLK